MCGNQNLSKNDRKHRMLANKTTCNRLGNDGPYNFTCNVLHLNILSRSSFPSHPDALFFRSHGICWEGRILSIRILYQKVNAVLTPKPNPEFYRRGSIKNYFQNDIFLISAQNLKQVTKRTETKVKRGKINGGKINKYFLNFN